MPSLSRRLPLLLSLALAASLGACRDREPEQQPEIENESNYSDLETENNIVSEPEPLPLPDNTQAQAPHAPAPVIADEQQVLDDAAAVGMTARRPKAEDILPDEAAPAGNKEEVARDSGSSLGQIY